jgi:hypothetical protein
MRQSSREVLVRRVRDSGVAVLAAFAVLASTPATPRVDAATPSGEVTESHAVDVTWSALASPVVRSRASSVRVSASPSSVRPAPPFFRLLRISVTREESPTALDSTGAERPCAPDATGAESCWRIRVTAAFALADPAGLSVLARNPPIWCFNVTGAGGVVSTLEEQIGCQSSWVSSTWPRVVSMPVGLLPVFVVEGVSHGRERFVLERLNGVEVRLASGAAPAPCPPRVAAAGLTGEKVRQLDPRLGIYDALRELSPRDERWDQLLRRVEGQRAALRKHAADLEDTAYEIVYIYVTAHAAAALQIVAGHALAALRKPPPGCSLTPGQRERLVVRTMRGLKALEQREIALRKALIEASSRPDSPRVRAAVQAIQKELAKIANRPR